MVYKAAWLSILGILGAGTVQAAGILYDCDITQKSRGGWISQKMGIVVTDAGEAFVNDEVTLIFLDGPVAAKIARNNDRVLVLHWRIDDAVNSSKQLATTFDYSARIKKSNNSISVTGRPNGYSNKFSGRGSCTPRQE